MNFYSSFLQITLYCLKCKHRSRGLRNARSPNANDGFTLIELMIAIVIIAVLAAIAFPSYRQYVERKDLAVARQEALHIAGELERFKSKNFSYKGFDAAYLYPYQTTDSDGGAVTASYYDSSTGQLSLPLGASASEVKYILTLVDGGSDHKPLTIEKDDAGLETADSEKVNGLSWVIAVERAKDGTEPKQPRNSDLLITSAGVRCMTKVKDIVTSFENCGSYSETW